MLTIYHSNDLDVLKSLCAYVMLQRDDQPILSRDMFLVQNKGMETWLKIKLAQEIGILANADFLLPAQFLKLTSGFGHQSTADSFQIDILMWNIIDIIHMLSDENTSNQHIIYQPLFDYLETQSAVGRDYANMSLAKKLARLFDQYLIARPEMILAWEAGRQPKDASGLDENAIWQADLWCRLIKKIESQSQPQPQPQSAEHIAKIYQKIMHTPVEHLIVNQKMSAFLPNRLFVIGISSLPPMIINLLEKISNVIDIHLFFTNPSPHYWGDIVKDGGLNIDLKRFMSKERKSASTLLNSLTKNGLDSIQKSKWHSDVDKWNAQMGHPLLASFGQIGRDNLFYLNSLNAHLIDAFVEPGADTVLEDSLLQRIQREIFALHQPAESPLFTLKATDHSILLHHGFSANREVEVLSDVLLSFLDQDPTLNLDDIVVMVPDIDLYEPFIHAIFGNAPKQRYLKYSVTDQNITNIDPFYQSIIMLLSLNESEFKAEEIASLLHIPSVIEHFGIEPDEVPVLLKWIKEVGIRFGRDGQHIESLGLPFDEVNSFAWGIKRMLLGYAAIDESYIFENSIPFTATQGMSANLAGKFAMLIDALSDWCDTLSKVCQLSDLKNILFELESHFFSDANDTANIFIQLHSMWQNFVEGALRSGFKYNDTRIISMRTIANLFKAILDRDMSSHDFSMGCINFCTLMPMRAIPFKVVCILGLNYDSFPKVSTPDHFDLIANYFQKGDRNSNRDDRYLFLEAILSAQNNLYLSFIGRSITDNQKLLPSVLVGELFDYIDEIRQASQLGLSQAIDLLSIYSPLYPFDDRLFNSELASISSYKADTNREDHKNINQWHFLQSYQAQWIDSIVLNSDTDNEIGFTGLLEKSGIHIKIDDLLSFYRDPLAFFCQHQLSLKFTDHSIFEQLPSNESFGYLSPLDDYSFNQKFVENILLNNKVLEGKVLFDEALLHYYRGLGVLPKFAYEKVFWLEKSEKFKPLIDVLRSVKYDEQIQRDQQAECVGSDISESKLIHIAIKDSLGRVLEGDILKVNTDINIGWTTSKGYLKRLLPFYLEHLVRAASGQSVQSIFYSMESKNKVNKLITRTFPKMTDIDAKVQLFDYINLYVYALKSPILWLNELHNYISKYDQQSESAVFGNLKAFLNDINLLNGEYAVLLNQIKPWNLDAYLPLLNDKCVINILHLHIAPIFNERINRKVPALKRLFDPIKDIDLLQFVGFYIHLVAPIYNYCDPT